MSDQNREPPIKLYIRKIKKAGIEGNYRLVLYWGGFRDTFVYYRFINKRIR
jgi:hypothetical protein